MNRTRFTSLTLTFAVAAACAAEPVEPDDLEEDWTEDGVADPTSAPVARDPFSAGGVEDVVTRSAVFAAGGERLDAARAVSCGPIGEQKVAVILVKVPNDASRLEPAAYYRDLVLSSAEGSINRFYQEGSYGRTWLSGELVASADGGFIQLPFHPGCDYDRMVTATLEAVRGKVDLTQYARLAVFIAGQAGCRFGGISNLGCRSFATPGGDTYFGSISFADTRFSDPVDFPPPVRTTVMAHELGHALGLHHSNYRANQLGAYGSPLGYLNETVGPLSTQWDKDLRHEYGDSYSTMGTGPTTHFAAPHKVQLGWLRNHRDAAAAPGPYYLEVSRDGDYEIEPISAQTAGIKALKIPRGGDNRQFYWVEFRQKDGFDRNLLDLASLDAALIHYEDPTHRSGAAYVLDMAPGDRATMDSTLAVGKTFSDPYVDHFSIAATEAKDGRLRVRVNFTQPACTSLPTVALSNTSGAYLLASTTFGAVMTVKNNDSPSCPPGRFEIATVLPRPRGEAPEWQLDDDPRAIDLLPRGMTAIPLQIHVPSKTKSGTYLYRVSARHGGQSSESFETATVTNLTARLQFTAGSAPVAGARFAVRITVSKGKKEAPVANATVLVTFRGPAGAKTSATGRTNASGAWVFESVVPSGDAGGGHYEVSVQAYSRGNPVKSMNQLEWDLP